MNSRWTPAVTSVLMFIALFSCARAAITETLFSEGSSVDCYIGYGYYSLDLNSYGTSVNQIRIHSWSDDSGGPDSTGQPCPHADAWLGSAVAPYIGVSLSSDGQGGAYAEVSITFTSVTKRGSDGHWIALQLDYFCDGVTSTEYNVDLGLGPISLSGNAAYGQAGSCALTTATITYTVDDSTADSDGDGIPNQWETNHGMNPFAASDAAADSDHDGLTNLREYLLGTNPWSADSDGDGIPDGWEVAHGLNPLNAADASVDSDRDGLTNLNEWRGGLDPYSADNPLVFAVFTPAS